MKKQIVVGCYLLALTSLAAGQSIPGQWNFTAKKISAKEYEIHYSVKVNSPWHIYSQFTPEGGPIATSFTINKNPLLIINSKPKEVGTIKTKHEEIFGIDVKYFEGSVDFVQRVLVKSTAKTILKGSVEFMLCNDGQCLPPTTQNFSIPIE